MIDFKQLLIMMDKDKYLIMINFEIELAASSNQD